jgi:hypothetical protein
MANQFPYLKSASEPLGVVEQIAAAVTLNPNEDAASAAPITWFGRMLAPDPFVWQYCGQNEARVEGREIFAKCYFDQTLRYTAYDYTPYSLILLDENTALAQGVVNIKGRFIPPGGAEVFHLGLHRFLYFIVKVEERWRLKKWVLEPVNSLESALEIIRTHQSEERGNSD